MTIRTAWCRSDAALGGLGPPGGGPLPAVRGVHTLGALGAPHAPGAWRGTGGVRDPGDGRFRGDGGHLPGLARPVGSPRGAASPPSKSAGQAGRRRGGYTGVSKLSRARRSPPPLVTIRPLRGYSKTLPIMPIIGFWFASEPTSRCRHRGCRQPCRLSGRFGE